MLKHIEKMRKKSDAEKIRYVFGISFGVTLFIAILWVVAVIFRISNGSLSFKVEAPQGESIKDIGTKLSDSWKKFFPNVEPATSTVSNDSTSTDYISTSTTNIIPPAVLSEPQVVEPYPADIGE